jgi:hypothetical protein
MTGMRKRSNQPTGDQTRMHINVRPQRGRNVIEQDIYDTDAAFRNTILREQEATRRRRNNRGR